MKILKNKTYKKLIEGLEGWKLVAKFYKMLYEADVEVVRDILEEANEVNEITRQEMIKNIQEQWE